MLFADRGRNIVEFNKVRAARGAPRRSGPNPGLRVGR